MHSRNEKHSQESGDSGAHISYEEESISLFMARRVVCCPKRFGINDQPKWFPTVIGSSSSSSGGACLGARSCSAESLLPRVIASESITNRPEASVIKKTRARESERHRACTRLMKLSFRPSSRPREEKELLAPVKTNIICTNIKLNSLPVVISLEGRL